MTGKWISSNSFGFKKWSTLQSICWIGENDVLIVSYDGSKEPAIFIERLSEDLDYLFGNYDVVGVDEDQFVSFIQTKIFEFWIKHIHSFFPVI
jgi:hypothetical protein